MAQSPTPGQINAYNGAQGTGVGVIFDALGNPKIVGANMPAGAAAGNVLASDISGGLSLQPVGTITGSLAGEPAGTLACTMSGHLIASSALATFTTGGQVAVTAIGLPKGLIISNIAILTGTTPANGPTHFWVALLDSTLHVLAVSADQGSTPIPASTFTKLAVTTDGSAPYTVSATGAYYIAASVSASAAAPTAAGITPASAAAGLTPVVCGTAGTQAGPPAVAAQLNSGTVTFSTAMNFAAWLS